MGVMAAITKIAPCAAGVWSLVGAAVFTGAPPPGRAQLQSACAMDAQVRAVAPYQAAYEVPPPAAAAPPTGDEFFRPSHFTVASVIVTLERSRSVGLSRLGSLYGP